MLVTIITTVYDYLNIVSFCRVVKAAAPTNLLEYQLDTCDIATPNGVRFASIATPKAFLRDHSELETVLDSRFLQYSSLFANGHSCYVMHPFSSFNNSVHFQLESQGRPGKYLTVTSVGEAIKTYSSSDEQKDVFYFVPPH